MPQRAVIKGNTEDLLILSNSSVSYTYFVEWLFSQEGEIFQVISKGITLLGFLRTYGITKHLKTL